MGVLKVSGPPSARSSWYVFFFLLTVMAGMFSAFLTIGFSISFLLLSAVDDKSSLDPLEAAAAAAEENMDVSAYLYGFWCSDIEDAAGVKNVEAVVAKDLVWKPLEEETKSKAMSAMPCRARREDGMIVVMVIHK
jgi:hypothetical protein